MRTAGPSNVTVVSIGAGQGQSLKAGAVVSLRVLEDKGGGLYRVAVGSLSLIARTELPLKTGSLLSARVERSGGSLLLRPLAEGARPAGQTAAGTLGPTVGTGAVPAADRATGMAIAALLREGLAPRPGAVDRVRRAIARATGDGESEERASLAARMEAKLIPAEEPAIEAIRAQAESSGWGDANGDGAGGGGSRGGPPGGEREADRATAPLDPGMALDLELPDTELSRALGSLLKSLVLRSEDEVGMGGRGSLLNLFNHRKGLEGNWIYAPFRFELDSIAFEGTIRIKSPRLTGGPGRIEAGFTASRVPSAASREGRGVEGRRWSLGLDFDRSGSGGLAAALRLACGDPMAAEVSSRRIPELQSELAGFGGGVTARFELRQAEVEAGRVEGIDVEA